MTKDKSKKKAADWAAFNFLKAAQILSTHPMRYFPVQADQKKPNWEATHPIWQHCSLEQMHLLTDETVTQTLSSAVRSASLKRLVFYKVPPSDKHSLLWLASWHSALWLQIRCGGMIES